MKERSQYYFFSFFGKNIQQKHVSAWDDFDIIGTRQMLTVITMHTFQPLFLTKYKTEQNVKSVLIANYGNFGPLGTRSKKKIGFSSLPKAFTGRNLLIATLF